MTPEQAREALARELPPTLLLLGRGAGVVLLEACGDLNWTYRYELNAAAAREIRDGAWTVPGGQVRVYALNMAKAGAQVQNTLLKTLEEPPPGCRFVLAAERALLPTVMSRCRLLVLGAAQEAEIAGAADKTAVATALKAAQSGSAALLVQAVRGWTPAQVTVLTAWAAEAASGRWEDFSPGFAPGVTPEQALRVLEGLSRWPGAKLAPVVALERAFPAG
jgi:hypothetical protein